MQARHRILPAGIFFVSRFSVRTTAATTGDSRLVAAAATRPPLLPLKGFFSEPSMAHNLGLSVPSPTPAPRFNNPSRLGSCDENTLVPAGSAAATAGAPGGRDECSLRDSDVGALTRVDLAVKATGDYGDKVGMRGAHLPHPWDSRLGVT
jgi:hypothetical protein